jgi:hypothetical protein
MEALAAVMPGMLRASGEQSAKGEPFSSCNCGSSPAGGGAGEGPRDAWKQPGGGARPVAGAARNSKGQTVFQALRVRRRAA